ncbi:hypothetical protein [Litoribrevibacter albus]|uniref:Uncharacterized protein n=1 Tax=Litoribrevibacter albus TaxID=1473156 RepID=A0AA37W997_9GAMM|nr:hypothetical protein [Litoribrevibacter albus]GLQ33313.1 hypothetical protein GCM10007876_37930 [Litoribrevibacter albus]
MNQSDIEKLIREEWLTLVNDREAFLSKLEENLFEASQKEGLILTDFEGVPEKWKPHITSINLSVLALFELAMIFSSRISEEELIYPSMKCNHYRKNMAILSLANNLSNTAISIRDLCQKGFDCQAKTLLRWFSEMSDTLNAMLFDQEMLTAYITDCEDSSQEYKQWRKYYSPKVVRNTLKKFESELCTEFEKDINISDKREENYTWLSQYSHADFITQFISAYADNENDEQSRLTFGGAQSEQCLITLEHATSQMFVFQCILFNLLAKNHEWNGLVHDQERLEWCLLIEVYKQHYLKKSYL